LLDFKDDGTVERELSAARVSIMQAALDTFDGDTSPAAAALRDQYQAARTTAGDESAPQAATEYDRLRLRAINAQRQALHHMRAQRQVGDDVFHRLLEELDWSELDASPPGRFQPLIS
jgi:CPA1 family monovalent cation:H+ antiporter